MAEMKLQRSVSRRVAGKEYVKHQIVIPNDTVMQLGWRPRDRLDAKITRKGFLIYQAEVKESPKKRDYETFKQAVVRALAAIPQGCFWSELRLKAGLDQPTPSPIYVKRMQDGGNLKRIQDPATARFIWKLPLDLDALDAAEGQLAKALGKVIQKAQKLGQ
jgi:bifunctional DNA-binding transcriptional regulator/antitoxin component of YhaV-PrlF toxin-antitoxin module